MFKDREIFIKLCFKEMLTNNVRCYLIPFRPRSTLLIFHGVPRNSRGHNEMSSWCLSRFDLALHTISKFPHYKNLHKSIKADEKFDAWRSPSKVKISDSSCLANFVSFAFEGLCSLANTMKLKNNINISFLWFSLKQRVYKRFPGRCMWRSTVTLNVCSHGEPRGGTQVY